MDRRFSTRHVFVALPLAAFALAALPACDRHETTWTRRGDGELVGANMANVIEARGAERGVASMQPESAMSACRRPEGFDESGRGWSVARTFLQCTDGAETASCLSDKLTSCPGPNDIPAGKESTCVDRCPTDAYVVAASGGRIPSGGGPRRPRDLPDLCTSAGGVNQVGVEYFCCPCE